MRPAKLETCANCNRVIGALETPYLWEGQVVCHECHARLLSQVPSGAASVPKEIAATEEVQNYQNVLLCTNCGSEDVRKVSMVWAEGSSRSTAVGAFVVGDGIGAVTTESRQSSVLASTIAPPKRHSNSGYVVMVGLGVMMLSCPGMILESQGSQNVPTGLYFVMLVGIIFLLCGIGGLLSAPTRKKRFQLALAEWNREWICMRCGQVVRLDLSNL